MSLAGDGGGVDLDHLGVAEVDAGLVAAAGGAAGADHRHRRLAVDQPAAAGGHDHGVGEEGLDLHRPHVLRDDALAVAVRIEDGPEELPELVLADEALGLPAAGLLVEAVEKLLAGGGAREVGPLEEAAAEEPQVPLALGGAVEGHAAAVEQVDDLRGPVGHLVDRRLVVEEVAADERLVHVLPLGVALLAGHLVAGVDAALGAHGVAALHRDHREQVHRQPRLGHADRGGQAGQPAADDDDAGVGAVLLGADAVAGRLEHGVAFGPPGASACRILVGGSADRASFEQDRR